MRVELTNKYSWWQVGSMSVSLNKYQRSKVCQALMRIQHMHMVCGKLHICHDLFLDQNVNNNAYSTPLIHELLDLNQKWECWELVGITIHFHIFVFKIIIILNMILPFYQFSFTIFSSVFYLINYSMLSMLLRKMPLEFFIQSDIILWCARMHYNMWIKCSWYLTLNLINYLIQIALVNGIKTINHLFSMSRCTYTSCQFFPNVT